MSDGVLGFECPVCGQLLEIGVHVVSVAGHETKVSPMTGTHYGHRVEFVAEAPKLHAELWGHVVREHQPLPHPYLSPDAVMDMVAKKGGQVAADSALSMWQQEYDRIQAKTQEGDDDGQTQSR